MTLRLYREADATSWGWRQAKAGAPTAALNRARLSPGHRSPRAPLGRYGGRPGLANSRRALAHRRGPCRRPNGGPLRVGSG